MHHHHSALDPVSFGGRRSVGQRFRASRRALAAAILVAFAAAPSAVAQVFPEATPTLIIEDNIDDNVAAYGTTSFPFCATCPYRHWTDDTSVSSSMNEAAVSTSITSDARGKWGTYYLYGLAAHNKWSYLVPTVSRPYDAGYDLLKWKNIRIEYDFEAEQLSGDGFLWAAQDADQNAVPEEGYLFRIRGSTPYNSSTDERPNSEADTTNATATSRDCSFWELRKITAEDTYQTIGSGFINSNCLDPSRPTTTYEVSDPSDVKTKYMLRDVPFRMRLSWYCGNLQVQIVRIVHPTTATETTYKGCGDACGTGSTNIEDCWCTVVEWTPQPLEAPLGAGAAGIWASSTFTMGNYMYNRFDNLKFSYWNPDCSLVCKDWQPWTVAGQEAIPFKFLYEGALLDVSAGRNVLPRTDIGKIDVATEPPAYDATYNHSADNDPYCNGWDLLEDLPTPAETTNLDAILAFLEPMHSAVKVESAGGALSWLDDFTPRDGPNPVPMIAEGSTPINGSLLEAYDWYRDQVTTGAWANDSYQECRQWFVILITDGDEACETSGGVPNPTAVCDPGGGAAKFANPPDVGVESLPVYTIGFSEQIAADSPLGCIAEQTGGSFLTAANASQLSAALYDVFYRIEGAKRSFSPFKIAPPPAGSTGNPTRDYLAVYPLFQPQQGQTLWAGNLWAYPLNEQQRDLPTLPGNDCEVDTSQLAWNAYDALEAQLAAHTGGNPHRFVYMGSDHSTAWQRYDLATMPDDAALRTEFKTLLNVSFDVEDTLAQQDTLVQQVVNFVRDIYMDNDYDTPGPPLDPRPVGYPVLGDFFHSQPVIVNPPNTPMYFYDYGFSATGEAGAHNYGTFMQQQAKRRRVVLAGANDGMLHAFDGGVWNRDRDNENNLETDPYDQIHDLGTGTELFAWVPQAVMDRLYDMTSGGELEHVEQQYMVDGPIVEGDAFIDHDGDGTREWRTVALASMRRGGRGILALDITQPDPIGGSPDYIPGSSKFAGCREAGTSGCSGEYPMLLWEFSDTLDENGNGQWDLGWTWSEPAIARIAVYNSSNPQQPDDVFVAFFGGGWDRDELDRTGTFFYGVDLATGAVVLKENMFVDLPGGVTALDSDVDGFHDRIYFADSDGSVHRLQFPAPNSSLATGATAGTMTRIFDFRASNAGFADRQEFFTRPIPVPVLFDGTNYTWAVVLGSGDRANLKRTDSGIDHVYFLIDAGDGVKRGIGNLVSIDYTELDGSFDCQGTEALVPPNYGWFLSLRDTEKVVNDVLVLNGIVFVPTFDPSTQEATNPPNACAGSPEEDGGSVEVSNVCRASGVSRGYQLSYECGQGKYDEFNEFITGVEPDGSGGTIEAKWPDDEPEKPDEGDEVAAARKYRVTNWRQE